MSNLNTKVLFISCIADKVNSPLYWKKNIKSWCFELRLCSNLIRYIMKSNSTELEQDVHAYWISCRGGWPKGFSKCFPSQWIPVLASTYSLPLLSEYLFTLHQCGTLVYYTAVFSVVTSRHATLLLLLGRSVSWWHYKRLCSKLLWNTTCPICDVPLFEVGVGVASHRYRNHAEINWTEALSGTAGIRAGARAAIRYSISCSMNTAPIFKSTVYLPLSRWGSTYLT